MSAEKWTAADIPPQEGRVAVITGANSGLGLETARALAAKGARVVAACRNVEKGRAAVQEIRDELPAASIDVAELDLASLDSVRRFAAAYGEENEQLDLLINNAGVMAIPKAETADGFELQFGTNHLGHFALTGLLYGRLVATGGSRIVTVSSSAHTQGKMRLDDLMGERSYGRWSAY